MIQLQKTISKLFLGEKLKFHTYLFDSIYGTVYKVAKNVDFSLALRQSVRLSKIAVFGF